MPVLIPLAATSHNNQNQKRMNSNYTYSNFDNLGMGKIEVCAVILFSERKALVMCWDVVGGLT
jgi:hypothetical protein